MRRKKYGKNFWRLAFLFTPKFNYIFISHDKTYRVSMKRSPDLVSGVRELTFSGGNDFEQRSKGLN